MHGKFLAMVLALAMVFGLMPAMSMPAQAKTAYSYVVPSLNDDGTISYTEGTVDDYWLAGTSNVWDDQGTGWYVVDQNTSHTERVTVKNSVNLLLCDGCTLEALAGIYILPGATLNIYGQSQGTGRLGATATSSGQAAIGGNSDCGDGYINIYGGTISAIGGSGAAGIGGGTNKGSAHVTINGGTVTATGRGGGAGIGGGSNGVSGHVTINGGTVTATGSDGGAGIGFGNGGETTYGLFEITINSGTVTAAGGTGAAGIGSGDTGSVTINNGTVTATGGKGAAGIGMTEKISVKGGTVTATGGTSQAGISSFSNRGEGYVSISGGNVTATGGDGAAGIGFSYTGNAAKRIIISGGTVTAAGGFGGAGIGGAYNADISDSWISLGGESVTATGGDSAAGIGLGKNSTKGGMIEIYGTVTATGGSGAAGIGGSLTTAYTDTLTLYDGYGLFANADWSGDPIQIGGTADQSVRTSAMSAIYMYYNVTFTDGDGGTLAAESVLYGKAATKPADPTKVGYSFTGWDAEFDCVKSDLTVNATWKKDVVGSVLKKGKFVYKISKRNDAKNIYEVTLTGLTKKSITSASIPARVELNGISYAVTRVGASAFRNQTALQKVAVGLNVKVIGGNAFRGCTKLASVTGCSNLKTIGSYAFYGCTALKSASIGTSVVTINDLAFYKCTALTKITIPAATKTIGRKAFMGCKNLKTVVIKTKKLTTSTVGAYAFKSINSKAVVKVPKAKLSAYKTLLKKRGITGTNQTIKGF